MRRTKRLGRYHLTERIAFGGMAELFRAFTFEADGFKRDVAIKRLLPHYVEDQQFITMLTDEFKLVSHLRHPNIAEVFELVEVDSNLLIAMEYVDGKDLRSTVEKARTRGLSLGLDDIAYVLARALDGLHHAHVARDEHEQPLKIVHRDFSPSNLLVGYDGTVKLCDFGIAKALGAPAATAPSEPRSTEEGSGERSRIAGKAAYMSPEHARGEELDARADIFSAGIVLWELCAGRRLYRGSEAEMLELARAGVVPPLPDRGLPAQPELQAILDRALAPDPGARWQTAAEMGRALDAYAMGAKLFASQLRFASFLSDHFEADVVRLRRARERAAEALELGPPAVIAPVAPPEEPPALGADVTDAQRELAAVDTRRLRASTTQPRGRAPIVLLAGGVALLVLFAVLAALALR